MYPQHNLSRLQRSWLNLLEYRQGSHNPCITVFPCYSSSKQLRQHQEFVWWFKQTSNSSILTEITWRWNETPTIYGKTSVILLHRICTLRTIQNFNSLLLIPRSTLGLRRFFLNLRASSLTWTKHHNMRSRVYNLNWSKLWWSWQLSVLSEEHFLVWSIIDVTLLIAGLIVYKA